MFAIPSTWKKEGDFRCIDTDGLAGAKYFCKGYNPVEILHYKTAIISG